MTTTLTQEEKRILIAEACGWVKSDLGGGVVKLWTKPGDDPRYCAGVADTMPDYFYDLAAMHQAEVFLVDNAEKHRYASMLGRHDYWTLIHATADQRAEAFGKTLNLW